MSGFDERAHFASERSPATPTTVEGQKTAEEGRLGGARPVHQVLEAFLVEGAKVAEHPPVGCYDDGSRLSEDAEGGPDGSPVGDVGEAADAPFLNCAKAVFAGGQAGHADEVVVGFCCDLDDRRGFGFADRSGGCPEPEQGVLSGQVGTVDRSAADEGGFPAQDLGYACGRGCCG